MFQSVTWKHVALSMTEVELASFVCCVQGMLQVHCMVTSIGLKVELSVICELDNGGARNLANNWKVGGCTRHVNLQMFYLFKMQEEGLIIFKHIPAAENEVNIFTKNVNATMLHKHIKKFFGNNGLYTALKEKQS